jgi:serine/arginine repetitive matrix protein 2
MILETLDRIRAKNAGSRGGGNEDGSGTDTSQQGSVSQQSLTLPTSQFSPNGRSAKRYSNNLFASGKFRDYTYVRSVAQQKRGRAGSTATTESSSVDNIERSTTPDSSAAASSAQSTPERHTVGVRSTPLAAPAPYSDVSHPMSVAEHRMSKILSPSGFKRASMALEEAMNQIEEDLGDEDEAEEEIVMPRISPASRLPPSANSVCPTCTMLKNRDSGND